MILKLKINFLYYIMSISEVKLSEVKLSEVKLLFFILLSCLILIILLLIPDEAFLDSQREL